MISPHKNVKEIAIVKKDLFCQLASVLHRYPENWVFENHCHYRCDDFESRRLAPVIRALIIMQYRRIFNNNVWKSLLLLCVALKPFTVMGDEPSHNSTDKVIICDYVLFKQQSSSKLDLKHLGIVSNAVAASSFWFSAPKNISVKLFLNVSEDDIRRTLKKNIFNNRVVNGDRLMIDIESPVHPKDFAYYRHRFGVSSFDKIIRAYMLRIKVVRELLPNSRIGLYGFPTPNFSIRPYRKLKDQLIAMQQAADLGLFDLIDAIYPVLYLRFGENDMSYKSKIIRMTRDGLKSALLLKRKNGTKPRVVPLLSYKIFNGGSNNHTQIAPVALGRIQLDIIQDIVGVDAVAYWTAKDDEELVNWFNLLRPVPQNCLEK